MTRRNLIITLGAIVFVVIGLVFRLTRLEPVPPLKPETRQAQEPKENQPTAPPKQEPRQPVQQQVPQPQVVQQPQEPSEDPERPRQQSLPEPSPNLEPHDHVIADVSALRGKLDDYKSRMGEFPATVEGLRGLGIELPKDRWGHDYIYNSPSTRNRESYDLFSAGPDGLPDTPDDDWGELSEEDKPGNQ